MTFVRLVSAATLAGFMMACGAAVAADVKLKSVAALPRKHPFNKPLHEFIKLADKYSKGSVKIRFIGGPDVTPVQEQMKGMTRGVIDVFYGPMSYYQGSIPEVQALNGSNMHAKDVRKGGGLAMLNKYVQKRLNGELIGYYGSGYTFYIYTRKKPKIGKNGLPDMTGWKLRAAPIYREMFAQFGASTVLVHVAEMYTALERGVVDGIGWVGPFVSNLRWDRFLKYRITPPYWQGDIVIVFNKDKWNKLNPDQQKAVHRAAAESEIWAHDLFAKYSADELVKLKKNGMTNIDLTGEAAKKYLKAAYDIGVWKGMAKNKVPASVIDEFKKKLYRP